MSAPPPHDNVCEWVWGNWMFPQLQAAAPILLLVSSNWRSCTRTCRRSLTANVTENVKPFSFGCSQGFHFWLDTLLSCPTYILLHKSDISRQRSTDKGCFSMSWIGRNDVKTKNSKALSPKKGVGDIGRKIKGWLVAFGSLNFLLNCIGLLCIGTQNRNIKCEFCLHASLWPIFQLHFVNSP